MGPQCTVSTDLFQPLRHSGIGVKPIHFCAVHHQRGQGAVIQTEHVLHHLMLLRFNHACIHTLFQAGADFFFGHGARCAGVNAQQLQHGSRGA